MKYGPEILSDCQNIHLLFAVLKSPPGMKQGSSQPSLVQIPGSGREYCTAERSNSCFDMEVTVDKRGLNWHWKATVLLFLDGVLLVIFVEVKPLP